jgi:hypothetical protein
MRSIATATIATVLIVLFLYKSNSSIATSIRSMTGSSQQRPLDPHPSKPALQLTLSEKEPRTSPPTLLVTATNLHDSTSLTLLTWDTPFDDKALPLGIFNIKNTETGELMRNLGLKINRVTPPPREAYLEIEPRNAVTKEVVLSEPAAKLEKGVEYEVQAKGRWKAVWHASVKDIGDENLKKMGGGTGVITWNFESDVVRVKA